MTQTIAHDPIDAQLADDLPADQLLRLKCAQLAGPSVADAQAIYDFIKARSEKRRRSWVDRLNENADADQASSSGRPVGSVI